MNKTKIKRQDLEEIVLLIDNSIAEEENVDTILKASRGGPFEDNDAKKYYEGFVKNYLRKNFEYVKTLIKDEKQQKELFVLLTPFASELLKKNQDIK